MPVDLHEMDMVAAHQRARRVRVELLAVLGQTKLPRPEALLDLNRGLEMAIGAPRPDDLTAAGPADMLSVVDGERVHLNQHAGQLLRTKLEGVDEGGVATGYSVLSSVALYGESRI